MELSGGDCVAVRRFLVDEDKTALHGTFEELVDGGVILERTSLCRYQIAIRQVNFRFFATVRIQDLDGSRDRCVGEVLEHVGETEESQVTRKRYRIICGLRRLLPRSQVVPWS